MTDKEAKSQLLRTVNKMALKVKEHVVVCGHGEGDPGAGGNGINERDWTRHPLIKSIIKYGGMLKKSKLTVYDTKLDMFQQTQRGWGAYSINKKVASVTELHLDAAGPTATGGHVIINSKYTPDKYDLAIANVIKEYVGLWGSSKPSGCYGRNNLLNLNVFAQRGINYRLAEVGFISSKRDTDILKNKYDEMAKKLVEAITGETLTATVNPPSGFNINNYYTTQFSMIKVIKDDYAYKEVSLKTKVGSKVKKGTILTVVGIEYSGQYPRFKLKSGLYMTTRKDTVEEYKIAQTSGYPTRKVGDVVTVKKTATTYQTGQKMANFVKGGRYMIKQVKAVDQSNSKRAYLLDKINSWVLEQDLE